VRFAGSTNPTDNLSYTTPNHGRNPKIFYVREGGETACRSSVPAKGPTEVASRKVCGRTQTEVTTSP